MADRVIIALVCSVVVVAAANLAIAACNPEPREFWRLQPPTERHIDGNKTIASDLAGMSGCTLELKAHGPDFVALWCSPDDGDKVQVVVFRKREAAK